MNTILLTKKEFKHAMEVLSFAAKDETRPIFQCVCFNNNEVVALDGYRLSLRKISQSLEATFCILAKDLEKVVKAVKKEVEFIIIHGQESTILFQLLDKEKNVIKEFNLREYKGIFPKYNSLIPETRYNSFCTVLNNLDSKLLIESLKPFKGSNNTLCFDIEKNLLTILDVEHKTQQTIIGENFIKVFNCSSTGENLEIAFNPKYLKDSLKHYKENFKMNFTGVLSAMTITSEDGTKLDLLLPIRLISGTTVTVRKPYKEN